MEKIGDFRILFEQYFKPLIRYYFTLTKDKEQSKDIVQGFFVSVWRENKLDKIRHFEAFAFYSVRNKSLNFLRDQSRFVNEVPELALHPREIQDSYFPKYLLESAIYNLPEKCQEVFVLSKIDGLTYEEIAGTLSISIKTVERQIGIGLEKLRVALSPYREHFFLSKDQS